MPENRATAIWRPGITRKALYPTITRLTFWRMISRTCLFLYRTRKRGNEGIHMAIVSRLRALRAAPIALSFIGALNMSEDARLRGIRSIGLSRPTTFGFFRRFN